MLKKIALGAAVGIGGAVLLLALALFVDVNRFKPQIESYVRTHYQRTLTIDGDLRLSVFPRIALALPRTTLSARDGDRIAASFGSARVSVALLPLLRGELRADRIRIEALAAAVERRRDGSTSIDDLIGRSTAAPGRPASGPLRFHVGRIELVDADLSFSDLATGATVRAHALNLTTGRLAPVGRTPVDLALRLSAVKPAFDGRMKAQGIVELDLGRGVFRIHDLSARLAGDLDGQVFELDAAAGELRFGDGLTGCRVSAGTRLRGELRGEARLAVDTLTATPESAGTDALRLSADLASGSRRVVADLASPAQVRLDAPALTLRDLKGRVTLEDPAAPARSVQVALSGTVDVDAGKPTATANLQADFDETRLAVRLDVPSFAPLRVAFSAQADRVDVDRYLPPAAAPRSPDAGGKGAGSTAPAVVDLGFLRGLNVNGDARIGEFKAFGIRASSVRFAAKAAQGRLEVAPLSAQLYGGNVTAKATAQADGNRIGLDAQLSGVSIRPLLNDAAGIDLLEGRTDVRLALTTAGGSAEAMRRALSGTASLRLVDGALRGIDLAGRLREARALLRAGRSESQPSQAAQKSDFTEIGASFVIRDGVARNDDLVGQSPLLRLGGAGTADIGAGRIDYTLRVTAVATSAGQGGRGLDDLRGVTVPVRLTGPFDAPAWSIDWGEAARQALTSAPGQKLLQQIAPDAPATVEQRDKLRDQLKDVLKGLRPR